MRGGGSVEEGVAIDSSYFFELPQLSSSVNREGKGCGSTTLTTDRIDKYEEKNHAPPTHSLGLGLRS